MMSPLEKTTNPRRCNRTKKKRTELKAGDARERPKRKRRFDAYLREADKKQPARGEKRPKKNEVKRLIGASTNRSQRKRDESQLDYRMGRGAGLGMVSTQEKGRKEKREGGLARRRSLEKKENRPPKELILMN